MHAAVCVMEERIGEKFRCSKLAEARPIAGLLLLVRDRIHPRIPLRDPRCSILYALLSPPLTAGYVSHLTKPHRSSLAAVLACEIIWLGS